MRRWRGSTLVLAMRPLLWIIEDPRRRLSPAARPGIAGTGLAVKAAAAIPASLHSHIHYPELASSRRRAYREHENIIGVLSGRRWLQRCRCQLAETGAESGRHR